MDKILVEIQVGTTLVALYFSKEEIKKQIRERNELIDHDHSILENLEINSEKAAYWRRSLDEDKINLEVLKAALIKLA